MATTTVFPVITSAELAGRLREGSAPLLIDVREPGEFAGGHIPGAVNIPLSRFPKEFRSIPSDAEVVLVCRSGNRSGQAQGFLRYHGYQQTRNLIDGMLGWAGAIVA